MNYKKITSEKAKQWMISEENHIILDVRSYEEYESGHIKESVLLPLNVFPPQDTGALLCYVIVLQN